MLWQHVQDPNHIVFFPQHQLDVLVRLGSEPKD